jgi:hypothetical protein
MFAWGALCKETIPQHSVHTRGMQQQWTCACSSRSLRTHTKCVCQCAHVQARTRCKQASVIRSYCPACCAHTQPSCLEAVRLERQGKRGKLMLSIPVGASITTTRAGMATAPLAIHIRPAESLWTRTTLPLSRRDVQEVSVELVKKRKMAKKK